MAAMRYSLRPSLAAQHRRKIDVELRRAGEVEFGITGLAAQRRIGDTNRCKGEGRRACPGDLDFTVGQRDDRAVARIEKIDALPCRAYPCPARLQHDDIPGALIEEVQRGAAYADGRQRRDDLVGLLG